MSEEIALDSLDDFEAEIEKPAVPADKKMGGGPRMEDPSWSEYVLSQFSDSEKDEKGNPRVAGLRRVAKKLLGPIVRSRPVRVTPGQYTTAGVTPTCLTPVTVEYEVVILWQLDDEAFGLRVIFGDCADVYFGNCDKAFYRFPSAVATTRAEGRCLRKALQLQNVVCAEELAPPVPVDELFGTEYVMDSQLNFMDVIGRRNNINLRKLLDKGTGTKVKDVTKIKREAAEKVLEYLSGLQNDPKQIKKDILGYDENWRS